MKTMVCDDEFDPRHELRQHLVTDLRAVQTFSRSPSRLHVRDMVGFDLDSTLADTCHRRALCPTVNPDSTWVDYALACPDDTPIEGTVAALRMFVRSGYGIFIVSNRPAVAYDLSAQWLDRHEIPWDMLALDWHKGLYLDHLQHRGYRIHLFFDDWPAEAAAIEALGVPVICVNPRYEQRHGA